MISITPERPDTADARRLIEASNAFSASLYPAGGRHPADVARLAASDVHFFVARIDGRAVGCGALLAAPPDGEIKRMFVAAEARGWGLGAALLATIEAAARSSGLTRLRLETGPRNAAALALYSAEGYEPCGPFPPYAAGPHSVFMEKQLSGG